MFTLKFYATILFSFFAAQALSLPQVDPRYHPGHDVRTSAAQSTSSTTATIVTPPSTLSSSAGLEGGFAKRLDHDSSTVGMSPDSVGPSLKSKARRREDNDSHQTLARTKDAETASHKLESGYGQDTNPNKTTLSTSTKSQISTPSSLVSTNAIENQKEAKFIKKASMVRSKLQCARQSGTCPQPPRDEEVGWTNLHSGGYGKA